jgi:hypothetical protein
MHDDLSMRDEYEVWQSTSDFETLAQASSYSVQAVLESKDAVMEETTGVVAVKLTRLSHASCHMLATSSALLSKLPLPRHNRASLLQLLIVRCGITN